MKNKRETSQAPSQLSLVRVFLKKVMDISEFEIKQVDENHLLLMFNAINIIFKFREDFDKNFLIKDLDDCDPDIRTFIVLCKFIIAIDKFSIKEHVPCSLENYCVLRQASCMFFVDSKNRTVFDFADKMFENDGIFDFKSAIAIAKFYIENCKGLTKEEVDKKLTESKSIILQAIDDEMTKQIDDVPIVLKRSLSFCEKLERMPKNNSKSFFDTRSI